MKKFTSIIFLSFLLSCGKSDLTSNKPKSILSEVEDVNNLSTNGSSISMISSDDSTSLKFTAVISTNSSYIRKVDIKFVSDGQSAGTFTQKLVATNLDLPLSKQLSSKIFTGSFTIENSDGIVVEKWDYVNGVQTNRYSYTPPVTSSFITPPGGGPKANECNFTTIHNCVARKIDEMGFFEYCSCLASAPGCYGVMWLV